MLKLLFGQEMKYTALLTNQSEIITFNQTRKRSHYKATLKLDVLTLFFTRILSPQQLENKSACLYTLFQNLKISQLHKCSSDHT